MKTRLTTKLLSILLTFTMLVPLVTLPASAYETDTAPVVTDKQAEDERRLAELEAEVKAENERRLAELEAKESERKQQEKDKKAHSAAEAERMAQEYAALGIDPTKPLPTLPPMPKITDNGDAELFDAETAQLYSETVQIRTVADLKAINGNSGGYYILMNDLSISGDWETIHIPGGVFNGNGHSIRGLSLHSDTEQNTFGILSGAKTILNLYATEININFIHKSKNSVKIVPLDAELVENCFVDGFINAGRDEGGRIIAVALKNGRNCTNKLSVSTVPNDVEYGGAGNLYMLSNCTGSQNYGDMEIYDSSIARVMSDCTDCINDGEFKVDSKATHSMDSYLFYKCTDCTNHADIKAVFPKWHDFFLMNSCLRCFTESDVDITLATSSDDSFSLIAKSDGCSGKGDITVSHSGEHWDTFYALLDSKNSSWEGNMTAGENVRLSVISGSDNCSFTGDVYSPNDVTVISHGNNNIFSGDVETKTKLTGIYSINMSYASYNNVIEGDLRSGRCIYGIAGYSGGHNSIYGNLYVKAVKDDDESYGITGIECGTGNYIKGNITADITAAMFEVIGICDSTDSVIEGNITNLYASHRYSFGMLGCTGCVIRGNYYAGNGQTHPEAQVIYNCDRCDYYGDVTVKTTDGVTLISHSTSCNLYGNTYANLPRIGSNANIAQGIEFSTDCSVNGDITTTGVAKGISSSVNCRINGSISGTTWQYGDIRHTIIYGGNSCAVTGSVYLENDWNSDRGVTAINNSPGSFIGGSITLVNEYTRKYGDAVISAGTPYLRMVYCDGCASHRGGKYFYLYDPEDDEGHYLGSAKNYAFSMLYRYGAETVTPSPAPSQAPDATPTPTPTPTETPTPTPTPAPKQYIIRLLDKADHTPIEGAEVTINGQRFTSNEKGTLRTTLKEGERNELKVEMAGAEMYRDPSFTPSDGRVTDIYIEQMSLSPDDIDLGTSASDTLHGPSIRFMGSDFELFNVPIDMNFSVLDTVQMEYSASDKTWKAIVGYSQSMSDLKSKKWSKPFADQFDNMKKLYESGKNGGLSKKDFADVNASKDFPGSIAVQGYLEFGLDQYRQPVLKTGGLMLMISTGISGSYPIPPAPYVFLTYSVSGTITGEVKLTLENAKYVPSGSLGGETALSGGVGLGANKIASVEGGLTGSLGTKVEFPFESLEKSFEVKAKLDIYMIVSVFVFSHKMSTTLAEYTIYPRSKLSGEDAVLMEINGEEDFTLTPRDYLHSDDAELQGSEGAIKTNLYTYSKVKTGRLSDGRILIVWLDDDPSRTDEDRTALYYCISDKGAVSAPQQINNDGTADFDFDLYADGERAAIVWQNASKKFAGGASMSDMAAATELSYCVFDGNAWGTPIALTSGNSNYEYGVAVNYDSDHNEKYVTWVQNSANDPLCNGGAKESIYRAEIAKDMSVKVEKMYSDLSGVVAAVPDSYGDVAYILDTDGDPTTRGSALYVKGEEIYRSDEDMNCLRSESRSFYFNDGGIMRDASTYSNNVSTLSEKHTTEQKYISPDSFTKIAVFKVNNGFTSDLYATYSDGIPVRITDFGAQIRSWDAVLDENDKLCIAAVLADVEITGENEISETTRLVFTDAKPFEDISLDSLETDNDISRGCSASFTLDVTNGTRKNISTIHVTLSGDKAGVLFDEDVSVMIPSGSSGDITVAVTVPEDFVQQTVTASITPDTYNTDSDGTNNSASIEAGLADLVVKLRQSGIAESGIASVTVENTGCTAAANTAVTLKNDSGAVIYTENIGTVEPNEKKKLKIPVAAKELTFKDEDTPLVFSVWASCDNDEEHDYNNSDACYVSKTDGERISAYVSSLTLPKGAKYTPSINITGAEDAVIYGVSDNEAVAVVDENGVITAVDDGTAQIVYMTADALMPVRVTLYVHDYGTISISEASYSNTYGGTVKLTANTADCLAEGEKAVMITALYDENGMLLSTSVKDDVTASEAVDISVSYIGQKPKTAKVMLWNAVGEVKPAAKVAEYIFE